MTVDYIKAKNISMDVSGKINTTPKDGQVRRAVFKHNPEMGWEAGFIFIHSLNTSV